MLRIEIDDEARDAARAAFRWYWERNPRAAGAFEAELEKAILEIAERPLSFPLVGARTRRRVLHRFPYLVLFAIEPDCVRNPGGRAPASPPAIRSLD